MDNKERKLQYKEHRRRVENAKSRVDSQAPRRKQPEEEPRELTFFDLMKSLSLYRRGHQRTFTRSPVRIKSTTNLRRRPHRRRCCDCRSVYAESVRHDECDTASTFLRPKEKSQLSLDVDYTPGKESKRGNMKEKENVGLYPFGNNNMKKSLHGIPQHVLQRYHYLRFLDNNMLRKLLRPKIFLDMEVKNERPIGRMVVQLYTEACPEIVTQFVRICSQCNQTRFNFTRLYPPLWIEGELLLDDDSSALTVPNIEHDPNVINHGSAGGILSFPSRYLRGSKYRFISFTVSFKPADVLNGKRIAFGRLKRGQNVLDLLQAFSVTRNGRPVKDIVVAACGVL